MVIAPSGGLLWLLAFDTDEDGDGDGIMHICEAGIPETVAPYMTYSAHHLSYVRDFSEEEKAIVTEWSLRNVT